MDPDAEVLETRLAEVMRLVSVHQAIPVTDQAGAPLSMAEGSLLVELLTGGESTQQQLADRLSVDKSWVSRLCAALERKKLLTRERDEANRRNLRLRLTDPGQQAAARLRQAWRGYHEQLLAGMTSQERDALLVGLSAFARELTALHQAGALAAQAHGGDLAGQAHGGDLAGQAHGGDLAGQATDHSTAGTARSA